MIPTTAETRALLRDIDQRNLDYMLTERIRGLVRDYLAPAPTSPVNHPGSLIEIPAPGGDLVGVASRTFTGVVAAGSPTPSDGAVVSDIPVSAAVPPPHRWRPDRGRAPAATTYADGPTSVGRPGGGGTASRPHSQSRPTGDGRSAPSRGGRMGRPSRPLPARPAEPHPTSGSAPRF